MILRLNQGVQQYGFIIPIFYSVCGNLFKETIRATNRAAQCLNKDDIGDYSTLTTLFLCECLRILSVICIIFVSSSRPKRQMKSRDEIQNKK